MRAAAFTSAAVIAIGVLLAIATTLAIPISWTALGMLAIAVGAAMGVMATEEPSASR